MRTGLSYAVGAATLWIPLYVVGFMVYGVTMVITQPASSDTQSPPRAFLILFALHLLTMVLILGLLAVYLVDVFRNPALLDLQDKRILWTVLLVVLNGFAMPVYWWIYMRPHRRSSPRVPSASPQLAQSRARPARRIPP